MAKGYASLLGLILFSLLSMGHPCEIACQTEAESGLTSEDRETLRTIARTTVEYVVRGEALPAFTISSECLKADKGAFVTLKKAGHLRGCIGSLLGQRPLWETVQTMAVQAATNDPRFLPVTQEELPYLEIEISVLSRPRPIERVEDIIVGTHGLIIVHGNHSGVLLPQVASEYGWDRETFLESLSQKAGLPRDAWKSEKSRLYVFTADVF
jgi:AmmeMemoRadiSam system protein A